MISRLINKTFDLLGYVSKKKSAELPADIATDTAFMDIYTKCKPFTMTSIERMYALYGAVEYVLQKNIPGDFCECGVWKGGSSMMIALTLRKNNINDRKIYLYDTFEGMSEPTEADKAISGQSAETLLQSQDKMADQSIWCYSSMDEVKKNLLSTGYPSNQLIFIKGKVEDTLPVQAPGSLALLRLDTDWYESTKIELEILYPSLQKAGVLIIDDFGHWQGAKKAVVEYFAKQNNGVLINRIDYTGRLILKTEQ